MQNEILTFYRRLQLVQCAPNENRICTSSERFVPGHVDVSRTCFMFVLGTCYWNVHSSFSERHCVTWEVMKTCCFLFLQRQRGRIGGMAGVDSIFFTSRRTEIKKKSSRNYRTRKFGTKKSVSPIIV